jgi:hypothetical protein
MTEVRRIEARPIAPEQLQRIVRADVIGQRYANLFPTAQSWKWFRRTRKAALLQSGALIQTTAGDMIDPALFEAVLPRLLVALQPQGAPEGTAPGRARAARSEAAM